MIGRRHHDRGSFTVELVLMVPVLMLSTLLVVHYGRVAAISSKVAHAADSAARAASLVDDARQTDAARRVAMADLVSNGVRCTTRSVHLQRRGTSGARDVTVRVTCTSSVDGLGLLAARQVTITRESTERIDVYTSRG